MIEYPHDFPDLARARVERTIAEAELSFRPVDDRSAVFFVLGIFEVFVWELTEILIRQPAHWTAEKLRSDTAAFLDRLVEQAYVDKYPHTDLRVHRSSLLPGDISYRDSRRGGKRLQG